MVARRARATKSSCENSGLGSSDRLAPHRPIRLGDHAPTRPVREVRGTWRVENRKVGARADTEWPTSSHRSASAPPLVAAQSASSTLMSISRTARAMTKAMLVTYDEPGLQSVASATVTPASSNRRAEG